MLGRKCIKEEFKGRVWVLRAWVLTLASQFTTCPTLGKLMSSVPQFPPLLSIIVSTSRVVNNRYITPGT